METARENVVENVFNLKNLLKILFRKYESLQNDLGRKIQLNLEFFEIEFHRNSCTNVKISNYLVFSDVYPIRQLFADESKTLST